jgi:hydrogenase maturation protease
MNTLVVGYGNTLRQDDALGIAAVERLSQMKLPEGVELLACHQLTPDLAERLAQVERAAFIDAAEPGTRPAGIIEVKTLEPQSTAPTGITHSFDPALLLGLAKILYGNCPAAALFTVTAGGFDLEEGLTPPVEQALPELVNQVAAWL